jgi:hypothetical protein
MPKTSSKYKDVYGEPTLCTCPRCAKIHSQRILWTGRGNPRIYCPRCLVVVGYRSSGLDSGTELNKYALQHERKVTFKECIERTSGYINRQRLRKY